ncbi:hypothetical protein EUTSA_v10003047mg [Eutrema salsugineum]|uniref:UBC core domain-containing protein n=1 Tax=Eutrema salsugineum TaxID=72664 RepID=V4L3S9_EUTSA|nr:hypothetical protein EUTSA_v10003047mg [Eutrema salsugineum]
MHLPPDYPFKPPNVTFKTKVFHPNVSVYGKIFLKMLTNEYFSPMYIMNRILTTPEISEGDYFDENITKLYVEDNAAFDATAHAWTMEHAGA